MAAVADRRSAVSPNSAAMREAVAAADRFSLLRLSLGARLLFVAAASALLWGAVFWALR
jgi:hypothetical protein